MRPIYFVCTSAFTLIALYGGVAIVARCATSFGGAIALRLTPDGYLNDLPLKLANLEAI